MMGWTIMALTALGVIAAFWGARYARPIKHRLYCGLVPEDRVSDEIWASSLYAIPVRMFKGFQFGQGVALLKILSRGRNDISSRRFNEGQPLELDIGVRIVRGEFRSWPTDRPVPVIEAEGTKLKIGPSLIGKRYEINVVLVTSGGKPKLTKRNPLTDVDVEICNERPLPVREAATLVARPIARKVKPLVATAALAAPGVLVASLKLGGPMAVLAGLVSCGLAIPVIGIAGIRINHPNAYKRWSRRAEHALLLAYWADPSTDRISKKFGRPRSAIESRLRRLGALGNGVGELGGGVVKVIEVKADA